MQSVYLCGAINGKTDEECNGWRASAKHMLGGSFVVVDPMARDFRGKEDMNVEEIVKGDIADIDAADFILVRADLPSWGTAMEVRHAFVTGKKIVAFTESDRISPWLRYHTHAIYESLQRACMAVLNFDVLVGNKK
jgi:nucleoside 2-deoxyribosyltransferase